MNAFKELPQGYFEYYSVDLLKNKKQSIIMYLLSIIIVVVMVVPMCFVVSFTTFFDVNDLLKTAIKLGVLSISIVAYIVLHEAVHGIAMKICGTKKVKYGFVGSAAYAGSDDYYNKIAYIFIALAPVVLWGMVLLVINILIPTDWFWVVYLLQIFNISGAAGDFFVTFKFLRFPKDILVKDSGTSMKVYSQSKSTAQTVE